VLDELRALEERRGVRIGLSVSGPTQADTIRRALELPAARNPFRCVQGTWNLIEPSSGPALAEAHEAGWGVIVKEALANGRLAGRSDARAAATLGAIGERHGAAPDAVALAAVLANPWADVVLSGAVTAAQVASNARALDLALPPDDLAELAALAEDADGYWAARGRLAWS